MTAYNPVQDGEVFGVPLAWIGGDTVFRAYGVVAQPAGVAFALPTNYTYQAMTLTLSYTDYLLFSGMSRELYLYVENDPAPAAWSDLNFPSTSGAILLETWTIPTDTTPLVSVIDVALIAAILVDPSWSGRLNFVLACEALMTYTEFAAQENATPSLRPVLEVTGTPIVVEPVAVRRPGPLNVWDVQPHSRPSKRRMI